jgi:rhodanese-related sulfurtransferase
MTQTAAARLLAAVPPASLVLEVEPAPPDVARRHYAAKLAVETDPSDVHSDREAGVAGFVVADTRSADAYAEEHIAGAISLPYRTLDEASTAHLSRDALYVVYCWGPGCNAGAKGAVRLAELGFRVKEMIGGIEYWKREGYPTESGG